MTAQPTMNDLIAELEKAWKIQDLQRRETAADDRVAAAEVELQDAAKAYKAASNELDEYCANHPDVRPWQAVTADIIRRSIDQ